MNYLSPVEGMTLGIKTYQARFPVKQSNVPIYGDWDVLNKKKYSVADNKVLYNLSKGAYDGDERKFVLMENKLNWKIHVICDCIVPKLEEFYAFELHNVGESINLVWSDKFNSWYISGCGTNVLSKHDEECRSVIN